MGGADHIFTGEHDAEVMHNSATINLNTLHFGVNAGVRRFFYSSSACIYPEYNQRDPHNPKCSEDSAYPAAPESEYCNGPRSFPPTEPNSDSGVLTVFPSLFIVRNGPRRQGSALAVPAGTPLTAPGRSSRSPEMRERP
jgi:hypothetical protein